MTVRGDQQTAVRHHLRPGDLGRVTALHGDLYAAEYGFDHTFEAYVAETLAEFGRTAPPGPGRLWLAEQDDRLVGSIGIVGRDGGAAQLRWLLLHPDARGRGQGRRLVDDALAYCRAEGYRGVFLWTVHVLTDAARLYVAAGFRMTEEKPLATLWGKRLNEQRYDLTLRERASDAGGTPG
jgi:GNAT superfamily N-acetyltransferase